MFKQYNMKLPKGQEDLNLFVISDVYINANQNNNIQLTKLKKDVEVIKNTKDATVVLNGNLFWFDNVIFGFDTIPMLEGLKLHFSNADRVKNELSVINTIEDDNKFEHFEKLSDEAKLHYVKQQLKKDGDFEKNTFYKQYIDASYQILQKRVYDQFIKMYVKLLEPIKDKIAILNSGNEENKVMNFKQYDPMYLLAKELGMVDKYNGKMNSNDMLETERFWVINAGFNNRLTDFKTKEISIVGTYGILQGKTYSAIQNKLNSIFADFKGYDFYVVSGYEKSLFNPKSVTYIDTKGNMIQKVETQLAFAGYRKVSEPNKVRLGSYRAENQLNNNYASISIARNPAYIARQDSVLSGDLEDIIKSNNLHKIEATDITANKNYEIEQKPIFEQPYKSYVDIIEFGTESQLQKFADDKNSGNEVEADAIMELITKKINDAPKLFNEALLANLKAKKEKEQKLLEKKEQRVKKDKPVNAHRTPKDSLTSDEDLDLKK